MDELTPGTYRILTNLILDGDYRPRFGIAILDDNRAVLYESANEAKQSESTKCVFSEISETQVHLIVRNSVIHAMAHGNMNSFNIVLNDPAVALSVIKQQCPKFNGYMDSLSLTISEKITSLENSQFEPNWTFNPLDDEAEFPKLLDIEKNYIFDWYDGPTNGVIVLKSGECLVYDRYLEQDDWYYSERYFFGTVDRSSIAAIEKKNQKIEDTRFANVTRKEVRQLFDSAKVEYYGTLDWRGAPAILRRASHIQRRILQCGWGGSIYKSRSRGIV